MPPAVRKAALLTHVASSVGWMGAVAAFLALAVAGLTSSDDATVKGAYIAMDVVARLVIVPLAIAALGTGIVQSLGTTWGLFHHYWVLIKLVITTLAFVVLLLQMASISALAQAASLQALGSSDLRQARSSLVVHAAGGLLVLLVPMTLSIYKPRGMTRHGQRKQRLLTSRREPGSGAVS